MRRVVKKIYKHKKNKKTSKNNVDLLRHAFHATSKGVKIPDGTVTLSKAQRFQSCSSYSIPNGYGYIALAPSNIMALLYKNVVGNDRQVPINEAEVESRVEKHESLGVGGDSDFNVVRLREERDEDMEATPETHNWATTEFARYDRHDMEESINYITSRPTVAKWRLCSMALKIALINRWEYDEGYFEAIRIPLGIAEDMKTFGNEIDTHGLATTTTNFVDQPSYVYGKLKDIHKYTFELRPNGVTSNWMTTGHDLDNNWDCILIRLTGRVSGAKDKTLTNFVAHVTSNQETVYQTTSYLGRSMTPGKYDSTWTRKKATSYHNIKAATKHK